jgi:hypothetical protein
MGKGGRCVRLKTLPPSSVECLEIWESETLGALRACPGIAFQFIECSVEDTSLFVM